MRTKLYYLGYSKGWKLAGAYAAGTKAGRRAIRDRLARLSEGYGQFTQGLWAGFGDLAEQRAEAIREGRAPRTIRPGKLLGLLERVA